MTEENGIEVVYEKVNVRIEDILKQLELEKEIPSASSE